MGMIFNRDEDKEKKEDDWDQSIGSRIFGGRMGSWSVSSQSDPRWNNSGRAAGTVSGGGPMDMQNWIKECTEKYGDPPVDCYHSFWKD